MSWSNIWFIIIFSCTTKLNRYNHLHCKKKKRKIYTINMVIYKYTKCTRSINRCRLYINCSSPKLSWIFSGSRKSYSVLFLLRHNYSSSSVINTFPCWKIKSCRLQSVDTGDCWHVEWRSFAHWKSQQLHIFIIHSCGANSCVYVVVTIETATSALIWTCDCLAACTTVRSSVIENESTHSDQSELRIYQHCSINSIRK